MELLKQIDESIMQKEFNVLIVSKEILTLIKEHFGNEILWDYDPDSNELTLIKRPSSFTEALTGLGEEMWRSVKGTDYIEQERDSWERF